jgi:hypothetical protein
MFIGVATLTTFKILLHKLANYTKRGDVSGMQSANSFIVFLAYEGPKPKYPMGVISRNLNPCPIELPEDTNLPSWPCLCV